MLELTKRKRLAGAWIGEFDLTTGAVRAIRDPNTFYIAATSVGLTDQSNYTTTINGKSIPNAQYPAGGTYSGSTSTSFGTGSQ